MPRERTYSGYRDDSRIRHTPSRGPKSCNDDFRGRDRSERVEKHEDNDRERDRSGQVNHEGKRRKKRRVKLVANPSSLIDEKRHDGNDEKREEVDKEFAVGEKTYERKGKKSREHAERVAHDSNVYEQSRAHSAFHKSKDGDRREIDWDGNRGHDCEDGDRRDVGKGRYRRTDRRRDRRDGNSWSDHHQDERRYVERCNDNGDRRDDCRDNHRASARGERSRHRSNIPYGDKHDSHRDDRRDNQEDKRKRPSYSPLQRGDLESRSERLDEEKYGNWRSEPSVPFNAGARQARKRALERIGEAGDEKSRSRKKGKGKGKKKEMLYGSSKSSYSRSSSRSSTGSSKSKKGRGNGQDVVTVLDEDVEVVMPKVPPRVPDPVNMDHVKLGVKELKELLKAAGVSFVGATEREDLVRLLTKARAQAAAQKNVFVATAFWEPVPDGMSLPPGLEVKFDMKKGCNYARLLPAAEQLNILD